MMGPHVRQPQTIYYHMGEPLEQISMTPTTSRPSENPCMPDAAPADAAAGTERSWLMQLPRCGAPSADWSDTEYGISEAQIRKASVDHAVCKQSDTLADMFGCSFARKKPKQVAPRRDRYEHSARVASVQVQSNAAWCGEDDTNDLNWCPSGEMDEEIVEPRARGWTLPGWNSNLEKRTTRPGAPIPADSPFALCPDDSELAEEYITDYEHQRCRAW